MKYRSCPICGGFCGGGWRTGRYPLCNRVPANHSFKKNGVSKIMTDKELLELAAKAADVYEAEYNAAHNAEVQAASKTSRACNRLLGMED